MIELAGERVVLRTLERTHCRELWDAHEPVAPLPTEPMNPGLSSEGADKWSEEMQARQGSSHVYLGILTREGRLVGDIQLADINWRDRVASLRVGIAQAANRGKGYSTDAARVLLKYGFEYLDLVRVEARTAAYNSGAQRVLEKCGFQREGVRRQAVYRGGRRWDKFSYGLLAGEFLQGGDPDDHRDT